MREDPTGGSIKAGLDPRLPGSVFAEGVGIRLPVMAGLDPAIPVPV
jgi:hypothetical protein